MCPSNQSGLVTEHHWLLELLTASQQQIRLGRTSLVVRMLLAQGLPVSLHKIRLSHSTLLVAGMPVAPSPPGPQQPMNLSQTTSLRSEVLQQIHVLYFSDMYINVSFFYICHIVAQTMFLIVSVAFYPAVYKAIGPFTQMYGLH